MNPNWGIGDDFFNQRENVQHFVKYVIEQLLSKENDPRVVSLKIQFHVTCNMEHMDFVIEMNRKDLKNRLTPLREKIYSTWHQTNDMLVKRIVYYITLATGLGDPSNPKVILVNVFFFIFLCKRFAFLFASHLLFISLDVALKIFSNVTMADQAVK